MTTNISFRLDVAMQQRFMTGRTLAKKAGVSECTVSSYRTGRWRPTRRTAARLAFALGVTPEWLLGLEPFESIDLDAWTKSI